MPLASLCPLSALFFLTTHVFLPPIFLSVLPVQDGSSQVDFDIIRAVAVGTDDCVVFAGATFGSWGADIAGGQDFAAGKIASNGSLLWTWQVTPN